MAVQSYSHGTHRFTNKMLRLLIVRSIMEYIYRFRSIQSLLGSHQELKNQEIYYSTLEDLNDPMEGFINLFWSGDKIVWTNLLKHYLLCLERVYSQLIVIGDVDLKLIPIFQTDNDLPTQEYKDIFKKIEKDFFGNSTVIEYLESLGSCNRPIHRDELCCHLWLIHYHALNSIINTYKTQGIMPSSPANTILDELAKHMSIGPEILAMLNQETDLADGLFTSLGSLHMQMALIGKYNNSTPSVKSGNSLILHEFPHIYVKLIEKMVYSDWYMACFSASYHNSSLWGQYADKHKGVCLKFRTTDKSGNPALTLNGITGWQSSKDHPEGEPISGYASYQLYKVEYSNKYPEIDFFQSLGRLTGATLDWWYSDEHGHKSTCGQDTYGNITEWRANYWSTFLEGQTTKLKDWKYEDEYRIILTGMILDYSDPTRRKLKYNFADLTGIIFRINTSEEDKLEIIRVIEEKCHITKRDDFEFYQAYYEHKTERIEVSRLDLIKF